MDFVTDGACLFRAVLDRNVFERFETVSAELPEDAAGTRLHGIPSVNSLFAVKSAVGNIAASFLGKMCRPVRAVFFNKTSKANWALGWHQDRTIAVRQRVDSPGFEIWSRKRGLLHVEPPFALLERMITVRVHLDDVGPGNAPLLIAPGSHRFGRVAEANIPDVVSRCGTYECRAERGDMWVYSTPILHASDAARQPSRRRVVQVDFSADRLPNGLRWLGL
jgi:ectoine hydroxylase-related dioxygenase (phytanoyl-CoA dioxygenase family)